MENDKMWYEGLTEKQRSFCESFSSNGGNSLQAAITAGYKHPTKAGPRMLENGGIQQALELLRQVTTDTAIKTREQRQRFWSEIMDNQEIDIKSRLRASELLGRSQADFIERRQIEKDGKVQIEIMRTIIEGGAK